MLFDAAINTALIVPLVSGVIVLCFLAAFALARSSGFMGLRLKSIKDPVDGTLHVVSASMPPWNASASNYSLTGVIQAPGIPASPVEHSGLASTSKWPQAGADLPVTVERAQPTKFIIRWDEVDSSSTQATRLADQLAQSMNQAGAGGAQSGAPGRLRWRRRYLWLGRRLRCWSRYSGLSQLAIEGLARCSGVTSSGSDMSEG